MGIFLLFNICIFAFALGSSSSCDVSGRWSTGELPPAPPQFTDLIQSGNEFTSVQGTVKAQVTGLKITAIFSPGGTFTADLAPTCNVMIWSNGYVWARPSTPSPTSTLPPRLVSPKLETPFVTGGVIPEGLISILFGLFTFFILRISSKSSFLVYVIVLSFAFVLPFLSKPSSGIGVLLILFLFYMFRFIQTKGIKHEDGALLPLFVSLTFLLSLYQLFVINPKNYFDASPLSRNVYFDIGANNGDSITDFLKNHPPSNTWHVVLVEANPNFSKTLQQLCKDLVASQTVLSCLPLTGSALTTFDGEIDIFVNDIFPLQQASSIVHGTAGEQMGKGHNVMTNALDVVTLFSVTWPTHLSDNVFVKIDIEGAEYGVLVRAITHGITRLWDTFNIEWHESNPYMLLGTEMAAKATDQRHCIEMMLESHGLSGGSWTR